MCFCPVTCEHAGAGLCSGVVFILCYYCIIVVRVQWWEKSDWSGYKELGEAPTGVPPAALL